MSDKRMIIDDFLNNLRTLSEDKADELLRANANLREQIIGKNVRMAFLNEVIDGRTETIQKLKDEIANIKLETAEKSNKSARRRDQIELLAKANRKLKETLEIERKNYDIVARRMRCGTRETQSAGGKIQDLQFSLRNKKKNFRVALERKDMEIKKLQDDLATACRNGDPGVIIDLKYRISNLLTENKNLRSSVWCEKSRGEDYKKRISLIQKAFDERIDYIERLRKETSNLKKDYEVLEQSRNLHRKYKSYLNKRIEELGVENKRIKEERDSAIKEWKASEEKRGDLERALRWLGISPELIINGLGGSLLARQGESTPECAKNKRS